jgi:hypothetical protein
MSKKPSQLERAIASIDADIAVLEAAKKRLVDQQRQQIARKPRAVKNPETAA